MFILNGKQQNIHKSLVVIVTHRKYIKDKKYVFAGRVKRDIAPLLSSHEKIYDVLSKYNDIVYDFQFCKQKFSGFGLTHN